MYRVRTVVAIVGLAAIAPGLGNLVTAKATRPTAVAMDTPARLAAVEETPGPGDPTLAEARRATERFQDVNVALAEGYLRDPGNMCETDLS